MTNSKELGKQKFYHSAGPPKATACRNPLNWPVLAVAVDVEDCCDKAVATCGRANLLHIRSFVAQRSVAALLIHRIIQYKVHAINAPV